MLSNFTERRCLRILEETIDLIQELEIYRDYPNEGDPPFSQEEEETLEGLHKIFDAIRAMPFYEEKPGFKDLQEYLVFHDLTWTEIADKTDVDKSNISRQYRNRHNNFKELLDKLGLEFIIREKPAN